MMNMYIPPLIQRIYNRIRRRKNNRNYKAEYDFISIVWGRNRKAIHTSAAFPHFSHGKRIGRCKADMIFTYIKGRTVMDQRILPAL